MNLIEHMLVVFELDRFMGLMINWGLLMALVGSESKRFGAVVLKRSRMDLLGIVMGTGLLVLIRFFFIELCRSGRSCWWGWVLGLQAESILILLLLLNLLEERGQDTGRDVWEKWRRWGNGDFG